MGAKSGSDLVVIAARRPIAVALRAVLHDWMVQGLVSACRIVDLDSLEPDRPEIPAVVLDGVDARALPLQQDLARSRVSRVRLAVVGVVDEEDTSVAAGPAGRVLEAIRQSVPNAPCTQLSVTAGSPGADWSARTLALFGWHNLAVSPEESAAPTQGAAPLAADPADPRWLLLLAGTLCSLTGLWPGQAGGPLDDRQPPSGGLIVPVRAYSRSVSSGSVRAALAERLVSVGRRYPTPRVDSSYAISVDDEQHSAVGMAEQLLTKHVDVMPRVRHATPVPAPKPIGGWQAVKAFVGFAAAALANAPGDAVKAAVRGVSQASANALQNAIFGGADSGYAVVVRGVRADGSSATWTDYEESLDSVSRRALGGELPAVDQKPALWHDFVAGGLTLLDAGSRSAELSPLEIGAQRAVVSTTSAVAADPRATFVLAPSLAAFLPNWEIQAGDDIAVGRLFERLDHLSQTQPHLAQTISAERNRLRAFAEAARASYAGHVGRRLGDAHRELIAEVQDLTAKVERLSSAEPEASPVDRRALTSRVNVLTAVALSLVVILASLAALSVFAWWWGLLGAALVAVGWAGVGAVFHMRSSAEEYAVLHRARASASELDDALRHRLEALADLRRISRAYRQYLDWSRVLGAFLHTPLGQPETATQRELHVGRGLPLNLAVGVATADREAIDDVANRWSGELFRVGWLTEAWREFTADLPPDLTQLRHLLQSDPHLLDHDPSVDRVPVLTTWSRALAGRAPQRPLSPTAAERIAALTEGDAEARDRLLSRVLTRGADGQRRHLPRSEFIEGLDRAGAGSLLPGLFNPAASVVDVRAIKETIRREDAEGLDVALVVVQLGGAYDSAQFAGRHAVAQPQPLTATEGFV